jgi:hypothetical protein
MGMLATGHHFLRPVLPRKDKKTVLWSGVDVMITIFCNFCQIFGKQLAFFKKPMLWLKNAQFSFVLES